MDQRLDRTSARNHHSDWLSNNGEWDNSGPVEPLPWDLWEQLSDYRLAHAYVNSGKVAMANQCIMRARTHLNRCRDRYGIHYAKQLSDLTGKIRRREVKNHGKH